MAPALGWDIQRGHTGMVLHSCGGLTVTQYCPGQAVHILQQPAFGSRSPRALAPAWRPCAPWMPFGESRQCSMWGRRLGKDGFQTTDRFSKVFPNKSCGFSRNTVQWGSPLLETRSWTRAVRKSGPEGLTHWWCWTQNSQLPRVQTIYRRTTAVPSTRQVHTRLTLPLHSVGYDKLGVT